MDILNQQSRDVLLFVLPSRALGVERWEAGVLLLEHVTSTLEIGPSDQSVGTTERGGMAQRKSIERTVQYWRIVDAQGQARLNEADWQQLMRRLQHSPQMFEIDGVGLAGNVAQLKVADAWKDALALDDVPDAVMPLNPETTYGITLAATKDFVPSQRNTKTGTQQAMALAGDDWEPVDNLFVWFLPFGNLIGVLAESTSSSRARKFADWLTRAVRAFASENDTVFDVRPVVDRSQLERLRKADGLKSIVYAGEIGSAVADASGLRSIFGGPVTARDVGAIRIELKVTVDRSSPSKGADQEALLEWYRRTFGERTGTIKKTQLSVIEDNEVTEIDLIENRVTRKTGVVVAFGPTRSFSVLSALEAIVEAFVLDRADLLRLRASDD